MGIDPKPPRGLRGIERAGGARSQDSRIEWLCMSLFVFSCFLYVLSRVLRCRSFFHTTVHSLDYIHSLVMHIVLHLFLIIFYGTR